MPQQILLISLLQTGLSQGSVLTPRGKTENPSSTGGPTTTHIKPLGWWLVRGYLHPTTGVYGLTFHHSHQPRRPFPTTPSRLTPLSHTPEPTWASHLRLRGEHDPAWSDDLRLGTPTRAAHCVHTRLHPARATRSPPLLRRPTEGPRRPVTVPAPVRPAAPQMLTVGLPCSDGNAVVWAPDESWQGGDGVPVSN